MCTLARPLAVCAPSENSGLKRGLEALLFREPRSLLAPTLLPALSGPYAAFPWPGQERDWSRRNAPHLSRLSAALHQLRVLLRAEFTRAVSELAAVRTRSGTEACCCLPAYLIVRLFETPAQASDSRSRSYPLLGKLLKASIGAAARPRYVGCCECSSQPVVAGALEEERLRGCAKAGPALFPTALSSRRYVGL